MVSGGKGTGVHLLPPPPALHPQAPHPGSMLSLCVCQVTQALGGQDCVILFGPISPSGDLFQQPTEQRVGPACWPEVAKVHS